MWCPTCDESRSDHPSGVCTTCGDGLLAERPTTTARHEARVRQQQQQGPSGSPEDMLSAILGDAILRGQRAGDEGRGGTGGGIDAAALIAAANDTGIANDGDDDGWERPPEEAMDPTAGGMALPRNRPTSKDVVARMPRIRVDVNSSVLHEAVVDCVPPPPPSAHGSGSDGDASAECSSSSVLNRRGATVSTSDAVVAEFGPTPPYTVTGRLVLADPISGSGGLSPACASLLGSGGGGGKTIAYFERGGNVTFARKALLAQGAGASAVIVGNNVGVWPYVMKDGKNESKIEDLNIPVVMVKRSDGALLRRVAERNSGGTVRCTVRSRRRNDNDHGGGCVVCREMFAIGDTVVRMPLCSHCFHERCALAWLGRHNTCPYCRRELPTDDEEYEAERRGRGRTHAGSGGVGENDATSSGSAGATWEGIFG